MSRITPKRALIAAGVIGIGLLIIVLLAGLMAQGMISDRQGLGGGTSADSSMPEDGFVADEKSAQRVAGGDAPNSSRENLDAAVVEQKVISNGYVTTESGDVGALRADAVKVVLGVFAPSVPNNLLACVVFMALILCPIFRYFNNYLNDTV